MNNIIKPFLDEHRCAYQLKDQDTAVFEHLFNYLTVRNYTSRHFDPAEISLGKGEVGIDGIAIIVNDILITDYTQIEECFKSESDLSVTFIFTQSKTSESFDSHDMSQFFSSVRDFINKGELNTTRRACELHKICKFIFDNPIKLSKNPDCHMFYSYTGRLQQDSTRDSMVKDQIELLKKTALFDDVTFSLYDADRIISACRSIRSKIKKDIDLIDCAVIPKITDINEAYIGIVKCNDFVKLITNEDGAIISNLFEDNVRYFQGHNTINAEIQTTLRSPDYQGAFSVLNNGVTIVAKEVRRTGNTITLTDFQVINGCQTSFVLYENRKHLNDNAAIVIKIISTDNKSITDAIVKSTNRQTPVMNEAFETLRDFHKKLELVYQSYEPQYRLYYERRSKQYDAQDINKNKIISFPYQTAAYIAVFLGEPHSTHRYYGELLRAYSKRIYKDDDVLEQYCMASMYVYKVDEFIRHNVDYIEFKKYRYHIALLLRYWAYNNELPASNSREMKKCCDKLYSKIKDAAWVISNIKEACTNIKTTIEKEQLLSKDGNDIARMKEFTTLLINSIGQPEPKEHHFELMEGQTVKCKVLSWNNSFVYVDIIDYKEQGSIHIKNITGKYIDDIGNVLSIGQEIKARILSNIPHPTFGYSLSII